MGWGAGAAAGVSGPLLDPVPLGSAPPVSAGFDPGFSLGGPGAVVPGAELAASADGETAGFLFGAGAFWADAGGAAGLAGSACSVAGVSNPASWVFAAFLAAVLCAAWPMAR